MKAADELLQDRIAKLRRDAVSGLRACGYSTAAINRMARGTGPFPASTFDEGKWGDAKVRAERAAFHHNEVLQHLRSFDHAWKLKDYATAVLCFSLAATESYRQVQTESRAHSHFRGVRNQRAVMVMMTAAAETYAQLVKEGRPPKKLDELRSEMPSAYFRRDGYKTFAKYVKEAGGMANLPKILGRPC